MATKKSSSSSKRYTVKLGNGQQLGPFSSKQEAVRVATVKRNNGAFAWIFNAAGKIVG